MNGILNLRKPAGITSHDCVARVRRALGCRRVGHAGTLDPMATGVLVVGVGQGTRVLEYLQGLEKVYRARMRLGVETDTQDVTGTTLAQQDASGVARPELEAALARFRGEIQQVPPMVSALKVGGRRLYELARQGVSVEREARPVVIHALDLLEFQPGARAEAELRVRCSSGTYVRTLCHDIGAALGVGAVMAALEREAVGGFRAADAVPPERLDADMPLLPLSEALAHLPRVQLAAEEGARLAHGQFVPAPAGTPDGPVRVVRNDGRLMAIAIARGHGDARLLAPEKVLDHADAPRPGS